MKIGVVELESDLELGKHAVSQIRAMNAEVRHEMVNQAIDIPGVLSKVLKETDGCVVLADVSNEPYQSQALQGVINVEIRGNKPVLKVWKEKKDVDRHNYKQQITELSRQKAEETIRKLSNNQK